MYFVLFYLFDAVVWIIVLPRFCQLWFLITFAGVWAVRLIEWFLQVIPFNKLSLMVGICLMLLISISANSHSANAVNRSRGIIMPNPQRVETMDGVLIIMTAKCFGKLAAEVGHSPLESENDTNPRKKSKVCLQIQ